MIIHDFKELKKVLACNIVEPSEREQQLLEQIQQCCAPRRKGEKIAIDSDCNFNNKSGYGMREDAFRECKGKRFRGKCHGGTRQIWASLNK